MHRYTELRSLQDRHLPGPPSHVRPHRAHAAIAGTPRRPLQRLLAAVGRRRRPAPAAEPC